MKLIELLKLLREEGPIFADAGICENLDALCANLTEGDDLFEEWATYGYPLMREWPKYTGEEFFPVPHPSLSPEDAYWSDSGHWSGEYGANRKELLNFLIQELEKC